MSDRDCPPDALTDELLVHFPELTQGTYLVTSECTDDYNCFAYAAGELDRWWGDMPLQYWPEGVPRIFTTANVVAAYRKHGFEICGDDSQEAGFEKIAIYHDRNGMAQHAARLHSNGAWGSKLGNWQDIEHDRLERLASRSYGRQWVFMKRPKAQLPPQREL